MKKELQTRYLLSNNIFFHFTIAIVIFLIISCDSNKFYLEVANRIEVEENEFNLLNNCSIVEILNDSICYTLNNNKKIVVYNYKTGKINRSFSFPNLNYDSLFKLNLKFYNYSDKEFSSEIVNEYGLQEEFIQSFYLDRKTNQLIIHFYKLCPYYNTKIKYKDKANSIVFSFQPFLIYLDLNGKFNKIVAVSSQIPHKNNLNPAFSWGFNIFQDTVFVQNWTEDFKNNSLLLKYTLNNDKLAFIDTEYYFPDSYRTSLETCFYNDEKTMYFSDQKNIYIKPRNEKIQLESQLEGEYIQKLNLISNNLFFITRYINKNKINTYLNYLDVDKKIRVDTVAGFSNNYAFYENNLISLFYNNINEKYEFVNYKIKSVN